MKADPTDWLLEKDKTQPAIRYYTLRDILGRDENDKEVKAARAAIMTSGPVPVILAAQHPEGYWGKRPRYTGTMPAIVFMAQLGADGADPRIHAGCEILLSRYIASNGAPLGSLSLKSTPSGYNYCIASIMGAALIDFGWLNDQRLQTAIEWLADAINGEGTTDASNRDTNRHQDKPGKAPPFACSHRNANLPCAWGAIKAMIALSKIPPKWRTRNMHEAIKRGVDFLLSHDPAVADYPFGMGNKPSSNWFKFDYPLHGADVLQNLEVLAALGQAKNPELANALDLVISKQNQQGRWLLERTYKELADTQEKKVFYWYQNSLRLYITGKELVEIQEKKGQPSKWVTLRALRVLKQAGQ
ncbi:MAG: nitrogen fixation protein NifH [Dehalococcoidales bacterium]